MQSVSNKTLVVVGAVCFISLGVRNLDLKYEMNEKVGELEKCLERERRENKLLSRQLQELQGAKKQETKGKGKGFLSKYWWWTKDQGENGTVAGRTSVEKVNQV